MGVAALGGGYYYYANVKGQAPPIPNVPVPAGQQKGQQSGPAPASSEDAKAFTGGEQGFIPLKLEKSEDVNSNTKKFIFALPEAEQTSGLPIACRMITYYEGFEHR